MDYQLGPGPLQVDQNTTDEKIKGDIGIVENGDIATHAILKDYYVIWKGDLYKAKADISSGTTLSAETNGNLEPKSNGLGGEVAALNSKFTTYPLFGVMKHNRHLFSGSDTLDNILNSISNDGTPTIGVDVQGTITNCGTANRSFVLAWRNSGNTYCWALVFNFNGLYYATRVGASTYSITKII